ncbi:sensor histidine kinase [Streptomyces fuscigenes]|uniref:sensor histidine kinase n=1 Tax=Streptomyces fuscigenes TaxID=1528880 RepID=UPI001F2EA6DE|nr:histidine kinase [Streptomyces fuscigenes]MCF3960255.1 histidine kinase [Streptomyces fuscigenes]
MNTASATGAKPSALQRGALVVEFLGLAGAVVVDLSWNFRQALPHGLFGMMATLNILVGPVVAVLAMSRRPLPDRLTALGWCTAFASFLASWAAAVADLADRSVQPQSSFSEMLALAVLTGAACRRLQRWSQGAFPVCAGLLAVAAPLVRDAGSGWSLLAAPAAQTWGIAVAVGLLLRDADRRRTAEISHARTSERLGLARDLHDLVIHYVTGIVVRTQAARVVASARGALPAQDEAFYDEIEQAGGSAVKAMRQLVGMLREDALDRPTSLREAVRRAVGDDDRVRLELPSDADRLFLVPELATIVHRVVLESLTNARRHAPRAGFVGVALRIQQKTRSGVLLVDIVNDGVTGQAREGHGFGLMGMRERVDAVAGTVEAGTEPPDRWRVSARLPLPGRHMAPPRPRKERP